MTSQRCASRGGCWGVDSAACVALYLEMGRPPCGLFVDYGQPARLEEGMAARAIAHHYGIPLRTAEWHGPDPTVALVRYPPVANRQ